MNSVRNNFTGTFGIALVILSALLFSLSGILTKAITADGWTILCWRGLIGGIVIAAYLAVSRQGVPLTARFRLGPRGWLLAAVGSLSSIAFIFAFKLTYVANVAVIYATAPFMAALLGWWLVREPVLWRTLAAGGVAFIGVSILVVGGLQGLQLDGDMVAVLMTFGNALYMVLIRRFHDVSVVWAGGLSALQLFAVTWFITDPLAVSSDDMLLLAAFGGAFAVANILWTEGTRRIPAAQSGLFGAAETPFAIILAWLLLAELPPAASFAGGACVLIAVFGHAFYDMYRHRRNDEKIIVTQGDHHDLTAEKV